MGPHRSPLLGFLALALAAQQIRAACTPPSTSTTDIQALLTKGGEGYVLSLCQGATYELTDTLNFTAARQEISTESYPTDSSRATIVVSGPRDGEVPHTTAISGGCGTCGSVAVRNIQINGNRGSNPILSGGANIEIGGPNANHLVSHVRSYDPRGWSCLHIAEGPFQCTNATIINNDIGPCGSDYFQYWSDGVSLSCADSTVMGNTITDATDGGIVVFGSPGSRIENNTIRATDRVMLGGINLVDYLPWDGNYTDVIVRNNRIEGGFADAYGNDTYGTRNSTALVKIGTAIGPRVWFNDRFGTNDSTGPVTIEGNTYSGAMNFAIAIGSADKFTLTNNTILGNATFSGNYGVNCTGAQNTPHPPTAFLIDMSTASTEIVMDNPSQWVNGTATGLTCFTPAEQIGVDAWPYGPDFVWAAAASSGSASSGSMSQIATASGSASSASGKTSGGRRGISSFGAIGATGATLAGLAAWLLL